MIRPLVRGLLVLAGAGALSCQPHPGAPESTPPPRHPAAAPEPAIRPGTVTRIDIAGFFTLQQTGNPLIYDVRPKIFFAMGHVPGAINWPKNGFNAGLPKHEPELRAATKESRPIVLYCTDLACPDAGAVARRISALGYPVTVVEGGFEEWKAAGLPTG